MAGDACVESLTNGEDACLGNFPALEMKLTIHTVPFSCHGVGTGTIRGVVHAFLPC
jgi:hypothetical protein